MSHKVSVDERRRLVAESLQVGNPGNHARDLPGQIDARGECQIELTVDEIRPYENNPRRATNARFDDIKESIRTGGLRSPLTVTQRPGEAHFIVEAGGNTRLLALRQLWAETRDPRYRKLVVLFRPWRSESHVLTAHLIENEQRGEMTFWDKASGIVALKARLEAEQGRVLTLRPLEDALHSLGLAVNTATLGLYLFATERLRTLGEARVDLSGLDVKTLQPRLNALKRHAHARKSMPEDELYATVFEPVFRRIAEKHPHSGAFSVAATCEACEAALAAHLGETVDALRDALRPGSARAGQGDAAANASDAGDAKHATVLAATSSPASSSAVPAGDLLDRVRTFADMAGLGGCVQPEPGSAVGYQLAALPQAESSPPERRRAWWLLAVISGQIDRQAIAPVSLEPEFLLWLADPADAAANAFWEVLACLRRGRGLNGDPNDGRDAERDSVNLSRET